MAANSGSGRARGGFALDVALDHSRELAVLCMDSRAAILKCLAILFVLILAVLVFVVVLVVLVENFLLLGGIAVSASIQLLLLQPLPSPASRALGGGRQRRIHEVPDANGAVLVPGDHGRARVDRRV